MHEKICPKCHFPEMKTWEELSEEEKMIVRRLPALVSVSPEMRKKNLFCPRCWHEQTANYNEYC